MRLRATRPFVRAVAGTALVIGFCLTAPSVHAQPAPFAGMAGSWAGDGRIELQDGTSERVRCRATYSVGGGGTTLQQQLLCASDSYRVDISSYIVADGHSVQGHWQEATRQVQGELTGQIADGNFEGSVSGVGFTAGIHLRTSGHKQQVTISPDGGDVAKADIVLSR